MPGPRLVGLVVLAAVVGACRAGEAPQPPEGRGNIRDRASRLASIEGELIPGDVVPSRDGIAAAFVVDVSSGMWTAIIDSRSPLTVSSVIVIGERAVLRVMRQFDEYAKAHPGETVLVGLYAFGAAWRGRS